MTGGKRIRDCKGSENMKHGKLFAAVLVLLSALLCLSCCCAEEDALKEDEAVLYFSSFAGGGYEYTVQVEDPSVVECETRYVYEEHAEEIDGASFDYIVTFTGLKPGSTTVTVYGRSPIMENEDSIYTVSVDEDLNVRSIMIPTGSPWRRTDTMCPSARKTRSLSARTRRRNSCR